MFRTLLIFAIPGFCLMANLLDPGWKGSRDAGLRLEAVPFDVLFRQARERERAGWLEAARAGDAGAQFRLGLRYYRGEGVPPDRAEARVWLRKAAGQGRPQAQTLLGAMCFFGQGGPRDLVEAARWFRLAAAQGDASAQGCLGVMHVLGLGVPRDLLRGYVLLAQAEAGGNPQAAGIRQQLKAWLTPDQVQLADRLAADAMRTRGHE
jgi:hypothetical protein